ncbi:MAG: iron export ABC transporter permease subunit FetB [Thermoanaerobaculales bacterium]|jgi:putative ABC transport system permease protein|nr:iron export ABC transporter permease subunit FetB [Thermoanaerobaculales bacterium]
MSPLITLGPVELAVATLLVVAAGLISIALRLGIGRRLAVAALRTVVQLGLLGLILEQVFALREPIVVAGVLLVMSVFAAREATARTSTGYRGMMVDAWLAMAASCFAVGAVVTQAVVGVDPWYEPRYVIPLVGMILGNSLTGIALGLDRFLDHLANRHAEVELRLAYGASRSEALAAPLRDAVRTGMLPIVNAMAAAGIVSLPGMMTGQILAGSPPLQAVAYQIVVMFMIAAAVSGGAMLVVLLAGRRFMGADAVLRLDRLRSS